MLLGSHNGKCVAKDGEKVMFVVIKRNWIVVVITMIMAVCLMVLGDCRRDTQPSTVISSDGEHSLTSSQLPEFISYVEPSPCDQVAKGLLLGRGDWAILLLDEIAEQDEVLEVEEMRERVEFLIDDEALNAEIGQGPRAGVEEIEIVGDFDLTPGEHRATVRVHRTSSEVLEYSWVFTVLEETTVSGLPLGLQFVRPLPDSTITLQAYQREQLVTTTFGDLRNGVCVGAQPRDIVDHGENLDCHGVSGRYSFVSIDGASPGIFTEIEEYCAGEFAVVNMEDDVVIKSGPSWHYKCWQIELAPGEHEVTVQLRRLSGEMIEYTWQFTITDD